MPQYNRENTHTYTTSATHNTQVFTEPGDHTTFSLDIHTIFLAFLQRCLCKRHFKLSNELITSDSSLIISKTNFSAIVC